MNDSQISSEELSKIEERRLAQKKERHEYRKKAIIFVSTSLFVAIIIIAVMDIFLS